MARTTSLDFDLSVSSERIKLAIAKLLGADFSQVSEDDSSIDLTQPCSVTNPWKLQLPKHEQKRFLYASPSVKVMDLSHAYFLAEYLPGETQRWILHRESDDSSKQSWSGYTNPLVMAVGERLAYIFGGELVWDDDNQCHKKLIVKPQEALFPPKKKEQTPLDRHYQFHNVLYNLSLLSSAELEKAVIRDGRDNRRFDPLGHLLQAGNLEKILSKKKVAERQRVRL